MTEQYGRTLSLYSGDTEVFKSVVDPKGNDGLRIRFAVRQSDNSTPNVCNVIVTNCAPTTAQQFRMEAKEITLRAGYGSASYVLFKGEIIQTRVGREDITDTYLHVLARSGERARNYAVVNKALAAGHTYRDRVDVALKAMKEYGITPGFIAELGNKKFPRNFICHGMAKDLLREVCEATGTSWSVQNNKFQIVKNNEPIPNASHVLNSDTGLIGRPVQTIQGIEGRCLLNGLLQVGGTVIIDERSVEQAQINPGFLGAQFNSNIQAIAADGKYKLFVVEHTGDTRGIEWYTDFIGIRSGDPISKALASRGILSEDEK